MIKAVVIDDELHCISVLKKLLSTNDDVEVIAEFSDPVEAAKELGSLSPDVVFLDIEMPKLNGFELLSIFPNPQFRVIFTTAYDEFAIQAFKVEAVDYLLKPIDKEDLNQAIDKVMEGVARSSTNVKLPTSDSFNDRLKKIAVPTMAGLELIVADEILYIQSQSNYSVIRLVDKSLTISKTLKAFSEMILGYGFVRIHNSYIINPNRIMRYVRGDGGYVIMEDGTNLNVSRSRKPDLLDALNIV